ncbi:unnamed protein product [Staurois parvus]|uniref:Uncharacterized protein n=1 Tax=Staurois parvus TaxID=386267 RepID=A0ABN9DXH6_9NEOB|nr:unnamed protein product [Staurois parvus]
MSGSKWKPYQSEESSPLTQLSLEPFPSAPVLVTTAQFWNSYPLPMGQTDNSWGPGQ